MYFSPTLQKELADRDLEVRDDARGVVCTRFRKTCKRKYNKWSGIWVTWDDLTITKIKRVTSSRTAKTNKSETVDDNPDCKCDTPFRCPVHDP